MNYDRQEIEKKIRAAEQSVSDLQEKALMTVPQHLLPLVNGGTPQDFKNVLQEMEKETGVDLQAFSQSLQRSHALLDDAFAALPTQKPDSEL